MKLILVGCGFALLGYAMSRLPLNWWMPYSDSKASKSLARQFLVGIFYVIAAVAVIYGAWRLF